MLKINGQRSSKTTTWFVISALSLLLAFASPIVSRAQESKQDHLNMAEGYRKKAAEYRQEIETHKKMLADYSKGVARNPKDTSENPYIKKMRLHCEKNISDAENLARDAGEMAKYHTFRAKELEGQ